MISLIGKAVKSAGNSFTHVEGEKSSIYFELPRDATTVNVKIFDDDGKQVAAISSTGAKAGERAFLWDGKDSNGKSLDSGYYSFAVEASDANGSMTVEGINFGVVKGISYTGGIPYLKVNGQSVSLSDIWSVEQYQNNNETTTTTNNAATILSNPNNGNTVNEELSKFISRVLGQ